LRKENGKLRQAVANLSSEGGRPGDDGKNLKINEVEGLVDKLNTLEQRIKNGSTEHGGFENVKSRERQRILELEAEQNRLTRQVLDLEDNSKNYRREIEGVENAKSKIQANLERLIEDHETLKNKSLDLLKRNSFIENDNDNLRKEKSQLVDNILSLQKNHQEELNSLRSTLESIGEKLYLVGLDSENKQTFTDLESRHSQEKKAVEDRNRKLREKLEAVEKENAVMDGKIEEQHQIITMYQKMEGSYGNEKEKNQGLEREYETLVENYNSLEAERDDALSQIKALERELFDTKQDRARSREEAAELSKERLALSKSKGDQALQIANLETDIKGLQKKVGDLEEIRAQNEKDTDE
jgi:chromosome segregation ATPase